LDLLDASRGKISVESPVGRALLGRRAGDLVDVDIPRGVVRFGLLAVGAGTPAAMSVNRKSRNGARRTMWTPQPSHEWIAR
jgi:hypothetical protein